MLFRRMCVAAVAVATVAACGGGGGADPEEDRASARQAIDALEEVLRDDGFESAPPDDDDDDDLEFESQECRRFAEAFPEDDEGLPGETAKREAEFERGELDAEGGTEESVSATVALVEDEEDFEEVFELYRDERLLGCLEEALQAQFERQASESGDGVAVEVTDLRVEEQEIDDVGDEAVAFSVDATLGAAGFEFPFHIEFAVARSGRVGANLVLSTVGDDAGSLDSTELLSLLLEEASED